MNSILRSGCVLAALILPASVASADVPDAIVAKGETLIATIHAEGAQIYECAADKAGKLEWKFREPIAALTFEGETIGVHYTGPNWELNDGSKIAGKVTGRAPGASDKDIPLLRLDVTADNHRGLLANINTIQRVNTKGGVASGACQTAGEMLSVPYSADYVFLRRLRWSLIPDVAAAKPAQAKH